MATKEQGYTDITATGARTGRQLQEENGSAFQLEINNGGDIQSLLQSFDETLNQLSSGINNQQISSVNEESFSLSPKEVTSSLNGDWGDSMWDSDHATEADFIGGLLNQRAENQWGIAQLAAGAGKMVTTGASTFLNGTLGLVFGLVQGIANAISDDPNKTFFLGLWDNDFNEAMVDFQEKMELAMPNYYTEEELATPWYKNVLSANFWGDKVLKNIGFTLGTAAAMYFTGGIGGASGLGVTSLGRVAAGMARHFGAGMGTMKNIMTGFNTAGKATRMLVNLGISSNGEASMEAINASKEFSETALLNLLNQKRMAIEELDIFDPEYDKKRLQIEDATKQYEEDIKARARDAGNSVWGANMAILSASNFLEFGHILKGGYKQSSKLIKPHFKVGDKDATFLDAIKGLIRGERVEALNDVDKGLGRKLLHTGKNILSEGSEEGSQNIASNMYQTMNLAELNRDAARYKYDDGETILGKRINPEVTEDLVSYAKAFTKTLSDLFGGFEKGGWEEFFLGGLTGGMGFMSVSRNQVKDEKGNLVYDKDGKPKTKWGLVWEGGFAEASRTIEHEHEDNQKLVDAINARFKSLDFQKRLQHAVAQMDLSKEMDAALVKGDQFDFKNSEIGALVEDYFFFKDMGMLDDFKSKWEGLTNVDDKTLQLLYIATLNEENARELNSQELESLRLQYQNKAKSNLDKFKLIEDAYEYVDARFPEYSPEFKYEMAFLYIKMADAKNRVHNITNKYSEVPALLGASLGKKLNYYLNTSIEKRAVDDDIWSRMTDEDRKDVNRLKRRAHSAMQSIKAYEKHPELLAAKLYYVQEAANRKKEGMDYDSVVSRIKASASPAEVNDIWASVPEESRNEFFSRIMETADDDARRKLVEHKNLMIAHNSMFSDYSKSSLDENRKLAFALYIVDTFRSLNHDSDRLIEAFENELDALNKYDPESSRLILQMGLDQSTEDGSMALAEVKNLIAKGIEHLEKARADYGRWGKRIQLAAKRAHAKLLGEKETQNPSERKVDKDMADKIRGEGGLKHQELTRDYLRTTRCFLDLADIENDDLFNEEVAPIQEYANGIYNTGSGLDFDDIDNLVYSIQNGYLSYGAPPNFEQDRLLHMQSIGMYYAGSSKFGEKNKDEDSWYYNMVQDVIENYEDSGVFGVEDFDDGKLIKAMQKDEEGEGQDDDENRSPSPLDDVTPEELIIYKDVVDYLGKEPTVGELAQILTTIRNVLNLMAENKKVPIKYSYIANIIDSHRKSLASDSPKAENPELPIADAEMIAMFNKGIDIEALKSESHTLKYLPENSKVLYSYGSFLNWKHTQFMIDNYLYDFKNEPVYFLYNTKSKSPQYENSNLPKGYFTALKYTSEMASRLAKDGNIDNVWIVDTQDGRYVIIGTLGYQGDKDTARLNYYEAVKKHLKPKEGEEEYSEEWHVGTMTTKILNIGDGRMVDNIDGETELVRDLKAIIEDPNRNPMGLTIEDLKFSVYFSEGHRYPKDMDRAIHSNLVLDEESDSGKVYLYIPTASGTYYRHPLKALTLRDVMEDEHKKNSKFVQSLRDLIGEVLDKKDWESILLLQNFLYIEKSVYLNFEGEPKIEIQPRGGGRTVLPLAGTREEMINQVLAALTLVNPRIQITPNMFKEKNLEHIKMLLDSGLLETLSATMLGTAGANYTISITPDVKAKPAKHKVAHVENERRIYYMNGELIIVQGNSITDSKGKPLTSALLDLLSDIIDCDEGTYTGYELVQKLGKRDKKLNGTYYFIPLGDNYKVIHRDASKNWTKIVKNKKDFVAIWKAQMKELAKGQAVLEAANGPEVPTIDEPELAAGGPHNLDELTDELKAEAAGTTKSVFGSRGKKPDAKKPEVPESPLGPSAEKLASLELLGYENGKIAFSSENLDSLEDLKSMFLGEVSDETNDPKLRSLSKGKLKAVEELIEAKKEGITTKYPVGTLVYLTKDLEGELFLFTVDSVSPDNIVVTDGSQLYETTEDFIDLCMELHRKQLEALHPAEGYEKLNNSEVKWFKDILDAEKKRLEDENESPMSAEDAFDFVDFKRVEFSTSHKGRKAPVADLQKVADDWYAANYPVVEEPKNPEAPKSLEDATPELLKAGAVKGSTRGVFSKKPKEELNPPVEEPEPAVLQTPDTQEYWRNPDNFESPMEKAIVSHLDDAKTITSSCKVVMITKETAIQRLAELTGLPASTKLFETAESLDEKSRTLAGIYALNSSIPGEYLKRTGYYWIPAGDTLTIGNENTKTGEIVGNTKTVLVLEVLPNGSIITSDGTISPPSVLRFFGLDRDTFIGTVPSIVNSKIYGNAQTSKTIVPNAFNVPTLSWDSTVGVYGDTESILGADCYTGEALNSTLKTLQAAKDYGFISPSISIQQDYISVLDWDKAVSELKALGFTCPREVATIPIDKAQAELQARRQYKAQKEMTPQLVIDKVNNTVSNGLNRRLLLELVLKQNVIIHSDSVSNAAFELSGYLAREVIGSSSITLNDWLVFIGSLLGIDFMIKFYLDYITETAMLELQKLEASKKNPKPGETKPVKSLENSEIYSSFAKLLDNMSSLRLDALIEALKPLLLEIDRVKDVNEDVQIPEDFYTALQKKGIIEEDYLNVKSEEQLDSLIERINNCR